MTQPLRIFLAHASEDKPRVRDLYDRLEREGFRPWLDEVDLAPGENWRDSIDQVIRRSDVFVACLSRLAVEKHGYMQRELRFALHVFGEKPPGTIFLIPAKLDDCEVPDLRIPELGLKLRDHQWVELASPAGWDRFIAALRARAAEVGAQGGSSPPVDEILRLVPTGEPRFPGIDFSLVNVSRAMVQVTSLAARVCARMKFERRSRRDLFGPRVQLSVDLGTARPGESVRIAGDDGVFNLRPGEAEALRITVGGENSLTLLCFEAEVVGQGFPDARSVALQPAVVCAAPSDEHAGIVAVVPKRELVAGLFAADGEERFDRMAAEVPGALLRDTCLRGAAFLCDGDPLCWEALRARYGEEDEWGSVVASFSEYARWRPCAASIIEQIDRWLSSPVRILRSAVWDMETRSITILVNRIARVPRDEQGAYLLRLLESTLLPSEFDPGFDLKGDIFAFGRFLSLTHLRNHAAALLAERLGAGAAEALLAFMVSSDYATRASELMEEVTHAGVHRDTWNTPDRVAERWIEWWRRESGSFRAPLPLARLAPVMMRALAACTAADGHARFLGDHPAVRRNLARNSAAGAAELGRLAHDEVVDVRVALACRHPIPPALARTLAADTEVVVRRNLACNDDVDPGVLLAMRLDHDEQVRKHAEATLGRRQV